MQNAYTLLYRAKEILGAHIADLSPTEQKFFHEADAFLREGQQPSEYWEDKYRKVTEELNKHIPVEGAYRADVCEAIACLAKQRMTPAGFTPEKMGAILSAYTGYLCCSFVDLQNYAEEVLKRPVWTHELATSEFTKQLKDASYDDFMKIANWCSR